MLSHAQSGRIISYFVTGCAFSLQTCTITGFSLSGSLPGRAGELGQLDPQRVRGRLRAPPRQDRNAASAAGGDLQAGEEHRIGGSLIIFLTQ